SDIVHVTDLARTMVIDWGMSERLGLISYNERHRRPQMMDFGGKDYSDRTAETIDEEIKRIVDEAHAETRKLLETHRDQMTRIAEALLKYETLEADEVKQIVDGQTLDKNTVTDLIEAERAKGDSPDAEPTA
ncbi:MAG: ATP-dependent zinc metalloprotease FtsH, partial [Planctomycetota bacterium]